MASGGGSPQPTLAEFEAAEAAYAQGIVLLDYLGTSVIGFDTTVTEALTSKARATRAQQGAVLMSCTVANCRRLRRRTRSPRAPTGRAKRAAIVGGLLDLPVMVNWRRGLDSLSYCSIPSNTAFLYACSLMRRTVRRAKPPLRGAQGHAGQHAQQHSVPVRVLPQAAQRAPLKAAPHGAQGHAVQHAQQHGVPVRVLYKAAPRAPRKAAPTRGAGACSAACLTARRTNTRAL